MASRSLIITDVNDQARAVRSFDLMPEGAGREHGVPFVPGQVAVLAVAGEEPAYFAFASAPEDAELEVLVKQKVGASTSNSASSGALEVLVKQKVGASNLIFDMQPGERIELREV